MSLDLRVSILQQQYYVVTVLVGVKENVKKDFLWLTVTLPSLLIAFPGLAADSEIKEINTDKSTEAISDIPSLSEIGLPVINAELLTQQSVPSEVNPETEQTPSDDADIYLSRQAQINITM
ncbi:MAG: hypothetical protein V7K72_24420 [Nostoc sp.]|uniref:hypothetical protein n=1 Tax=Nostoc sp. TaxID=1180 RepID=UPI002FF88BBF